MRLSSYHQLESNDENKEKEYYERKTMIEKKRELAFADIPLDYFFFIFRKKISFEENSRFR
jgi:hypothetical protein